MILEVPAQKHVPSLYVDSPSFFPRFNKNWKLDRSTNFWKYFQHQVVLKSAIQNFTNTNFLQLFILTPKKKRRVVIRDSVRNIGFSFPKLSLFSEQTTRIIEPFACSAFVYSAGPAAETLQ